MSQINHIDCIWIDVNSGCYEIVYKRPTKQDVELDNEIISLTNSIKELEVKKNETLLSNDLNQYKVIKSFIEDKQKLIKTKQNKRNSYLDQVNYYKLLLSKFTEAKVDNPTGCINKNYLNYTLPEPTSFNEMKEKIKEAGQLIMPLYQYIRLINASIFGQSDITCDCFSKIKSMVVDLEEKTILNNFDKDVLLHLTHCCLTADFTLTNEVHNPVIIDTHNCRKTV
jgi:hypothetical protein